MVTKQPSLSLLSAYDDDDDGGADEGSGESHAQNGVVVIKETETITQTESKTANTDAFSLVSYDNDADEADMDSTDANQINTGRAILMSKKSEPVNPDSPIIDPTPPTISPPTTPASSSKTYRPSSPARIDSLIPAEPPGECDPEVVSRLEKYHELRLNGKTLNDNLRQSKAFKNPDILEKLVLYCEIDEVASNYPKHLFDPTAFHPDDFYDKIALEQRRLEEKKEQEKAYPNRTQVEFVTGNKTSITEKKSTASKGKSKWDSAEVSKPATNTSAYSEYVKQKKREAEKSDEAAAAKKPRL